METERAGPRPLDHGSEARLRTRLAARLGSTWQMLQSVDELWHYVTGDVPAVPASLGPMGLQVKVYGSSRPGYIAIALHCEFKENPFWDYPVHSSLAMLRMAVIIVHSMMRQLDK